MLFGVLIVVILGACGNIFLNKLGVSPLASQIIMFIFIFAALKVICGG